jgi:ribosome biogenesis SPOUT family RNA methylase Rps3
MAKMSTQEQRWQAESDAETMARYQEIMGDNARKNRAIKAATQRATELTKRANAMKMACGGKLNKK